MVLAAVGLFLETFIVASICVLLLALLDNPLKILMTRAVAKAVARARARARTLGMATTLVASTAFVLVLLMCASNGSTSMSRQC